MLVDVAVTLTVVEGVVVAKLVTGVSKQLQTLPMNGLACFVRLQNWDDFGLFGAVVVWSLIKTSWSASRLLTNETV